MTTTLWVTGLKMTPAAIDAATPPDRGTRYADALRLSGDHDGGYIGRDWLVAVVWHDGGGLQAGSALSLVPGTQWLTWLFQVVTPLFFFVGGFAHAVALRRSARTPAAGRADRGRAARLLRPAVALFASWVPLTAVVAATGVDAQLLRLATQAVIVPTWFLATYLVIVALVPVTARLHRRFGLGRAGRAGRAGGAGRRGAPGGGAGHRLRELRPGLGGGAPGRLPLGRTAPAAARRRRAGPLRRRPRGALAALVFVAGYPVSMVGVDGAARTSMGPPTIALVALGTAQVGLVLALRSPSRAPPRPSAGSGRPSCVPGH